MSPAYYTYKITFPGTPYYYWGYHKHSKKDYWGSPSTNKWVWDFYDPEKQILEWFETREEAIAVEARLIRPCLNDVNCLNEGTGAGFSSASASKGGKIAFAKKTPEQLSELGKKAIAIRYANESPEQRSEAARKGMAARTPEQRSESSRKGNLAQTPEQRRERQKKAAAARTPEQRSAAIKKGWETRRQNRLNNGEQTY